MNKDFENEIIAIAKGSKASGFLSESANSLVDSIYLGALEELFSISEDAVAIYNSNSSKTSLSSYRLPKEFLEMFLEIPGRRGGFCIISPLRLVIFFDEDPDLITVIGKKRNAKSGANTSGAKASQLLKVSFSNRDGEYTYKDNTGGRLDPHDIVALLIRWSVAV